MHKLIASCILAVLITSCTNQPSKELAQENLKKSFDNKIEVVDFKYINALKTEKDKVVHYKYYFDATIKFTEDWADNSPKYQGMSYSKGDLYKIDYGYIEFIQTENGWAANSINFKEKGGFTEIIADNSLENKENRQPLLFHDFWASVSWRFQAKQMTPGMRSWLYRIAEKQTQSYSEAMALLENIENDANFQEKVLQTAYEPKKENYRFTLANLCGSFNLGNPVADYYFEKYATK